jgi:hypothetical protein
MMEEELVEGSPKIVAADASYISKAGKHTDGLGKFWNGCKGKSEKGLEISTIAVVDLLANTAYALDTRQTMGESEDSRTEQYAAQIIDCLPHFLQLGITHLAVDGYYSKQNFLNPVSNSGLHVVGKLRKDAQLWWLFEGQQSGKGRPKKYDEKVVHRGPLTKWTNCGHLEDGSEIYEAIVYSKTFKMKLKVVLIRKSKSDGNFYQALLLSTDLDLLAKTVVHYYRSRFQIEFLFRDAKQHTGLTDCQARSKEAIKTHVNASMSTLNLLKMEDRKSKNSCRPTVISIASWRRRKSNQNLMRRLFHELEIDPTNKKVQAVFKELGEYGVIAA